MIEVFLICWSCYVLLYEVVFDFGQLLFLNLFLCVEQFDVLEFFYLLCIYCCFKCGLVQVFEVQILEVIFVDDYVYFLLVFLSWVENVRCYVEVMVEWFGFGFESLVIEVVSNDGYLLQYVVVWGIFVFGIELVCNIVIEVQLWGVFMFNCFFIEVNGQGVVEGIVYLGELSDFLFFGCRVDFVVVNNVFVYVLDFNDFIVGLVVILVLIGVLMIEVQYFF